MLSTVATAALSVWLHDSTTTAFDNWMLRVLYNHIGQTGSQPLLGISEPMLTFTLLAAVVIFAALVRLWTVVALALIGPLVALGLTELVLKPLVHRTIGKSILQNDPYPGFGTAFPSGHETGVMAAALVLALVLHRSPLPKSWRITGWVVLALWTVVAALGLVRGFYHYATDTVGAITLTTASVLGTALVIDAATHASQPRSPAGAERQLTRRS
ncbi:MAG TPA: hypothetical protein VHS54_09480 [Jatrophihabitans sp.]|nr:hypothetical protein [Jatrophihabitans sp.]